MDTQTFSPATTKMQFKTELNNEEIKWLNRAIVKHFSHKHLNTLHGKNYIYQGRSLKALENIMGLPYTSTGLYAALWVTNTEVYFDVDNIYKYEGFATGIDNKHYAILQDCKENELIIEL